MLLEEMDAEFSQMGEGNTSSGDKVSQRVSLSDPEGLDQLRSWGVAVG